MSDFPDLEQALHHQSIVGGDTWSMTVKRGQQVVLVDASGKGNCTMLAYHARVPSERYNMPDTLKGQHTAKLTTGHCLYTDMGRVLFSIVADDRGWHDPLGGYSNQAMVEKKFGRRSFQEYRNAWTRNTRDNLLVEIGKHGLDGRDLHAPVNWFTTIVVEDGGTLRWDASRNTAGQRVVLRAELDVLAIFSATPHPLDPGTDWQPQAIEAYLCRGEPAGDDDPCRQHCPENGRALTLTEQAVLAY